MFDSRLGFGGMPGISFPYMTLTASPATTLVIINASNTIVPTYTLPPIDQTKQGTTYVITKVTTTDITLQADGADLIWDGVSDAGSKTLSSVNPNESVEILSNGIKWFI